MGLHEDLRDCFMLGLLCGLGSGIFGVLFALWIFGGF